MKRALSLATSLVFLAACSGNAVAPRATSGVPAGTGSSALSGAARERRHGKLVLRFKIPKKPQRIRIVRNGRPRYISPATQSMSIAITGPTNVTEAVGLTVGSGNCTSTLTSTLCTLSIPGLAVGTGYLISIATYDGPVAGSAPTGRLLSQNQNVGFSIVAGQTNTIQLTLGGIAQSFAIAPLSPSFQFDSNGYTLYGNLPAEFVVTPLDADGEPIVGAGAPAPTASLAPGAAATVGLPNSANPNLFQIRGSYSAADPTVPSQTSLTISATPVPGSGGSPLTRTLALNQYQPWVYVIDQTATTIRVFDEAGNQLSASATFTTPSGCQTLGGLAYGRSQIYGFYSYSGGATACIVKWALTGGAYKSSATRSNIAAIGDDGSASGAAFDPHDDELYVIGTGTNGGSGYVQSYDANVTTNYANESINVYGGSGLTYLPTTNQIAVVTGTSPGTYLCNEALSSCNLMSGISNSPTGGITYDPYNGYLGVGVSNGLQLYNFSGTKVGFIGSAVPSTGVVFDPYQADYVYGLCFAPGICGIDLFSESNNQTGQLTWPMADTPGQIVVVP